jgi:hypothetical protein
MKNTKHFRERSLITGKIGDVHGLESSLSLRCQFFSN